MNTQTTETTQSTDRTDSLISDIADSIQAQIAGTATPQTRRSETKLSYKMISTPPRLRKGQCSQAFAGLAEIGEGTLDEVVDQVVRLHPNYKTKFNLRESVKFHLHCLSREGFVEEVN